MAEKIASYGSAIVGNPWKNWFFLKLETDDGFEGSGEASLSVILVKSDLSNPVFFMVLVKF